MLRQTLKCLRLGNSDVLISSSNQHLKHRTSDMASISGCLIQKAIAMAPSASVSNASRLMDFRLGKCNLIRSLASRWLNLVPKDILCNDVRFEMLSSILSRSKSGRVNDINSRRRNSRSW